MTESERNALLEGGIHKETILRMVNRLGHLIAAGDVLRAQVETLIPILAGPSGRDPLQTSEGCLVSRGRLVSLIEEEEHELGARLARILGERYSEGDGT